MLKKNKNENKKFSGLEIVLTAIMLFIGNKKKSLIALIIGYLLGWGGNPVHLENILPINIRSE